MARSAAKLAPHWLTVLSALLMVASFPPWGFSALIWLFLVPWFFALQQSADWKKALQEGVWLSFLVTVFGFSWIAFVLHEFGNLPWVISIAAFLVFAFFGQPQFIILGALFRFLHEKFLFRGSQKASAAHGMSRFIILCFPLISAALYAGMDWLIPKLFTDTLGHSLYSVKTLRQAADIGGVYLLTTVIFIVNETLFVLSWLVKKALQKQPQSYGFALPHGIYALIAITALFIYGDKRLTEIQGITGKATHFVRGRAIQANIGDFDKVAAERGIRGATEKVLSTYFKLSDQALSLSEEKPDFLVWPETAYPSTFRTPHTTSELASDQLMESYVRTRKVPLLFGGYDRWNFKEYNALFILSPFADPGITGTADLQIYRKNMLLLFGEYIPGASHFRFIRDAFPQVGNFGRGTGPEVHSLPIARLPSGQFKLGPVICYEALFPNYVIEAARNGSQLILNITNDSWFGPFAEPPLHLMLVAFRSIETRLPQLRATNTGISALILPDGEITRPTAIGEPAILDSKIPVYEPIPTLMKKWGDWFGLFALLTGLIGLVSLLQISRKSVQTSDT
jgi:apolipoprotein N-acyltransferase